jgi:uncharacterized protein (UPF0548 family)
VKEVLARATRSELTYGEVGATRDAGLPPGYRHLQCRVRVGNGDGVYARSVGRLFAWEVQRLAGLDVEPGEAPVEAGTTVVLVGRLPLLRLVVPCRVVWAETGRRRSGFAYGTLPGHPERGEEAFVVEQDAAGDVWFQVRAFSRPARWYARLGAPVTQRVQRLITKRYLRAMAS